MQLIINTNLDSGERKAQISNHLSLLGMGLYNNCKKSEIIDEKTKSQISGSLCIAYMEQRYKDYLNITVKQFRDMTSSSKAIFNIELSDDDILTVAELARELNATQADESECC